MQNVHSNRSPRSVATAMFEDGVSTFSMSNKMTYGDLAGRLDNLSGWRRRKPVALIVKMA